MTTTAKPEITAPAMSSPEPLVAVVYPLSEGGTRWRASVLDARTLAVVAERDVELDPMLGGGSGEAFQDFLDLSVEALGYHRGGEVTHAAAAIAAATGAEPEPCLLDASPRRVYAWPAFALPEVRRPEWATRSAGEDALQDAYFRDTDGTIVLDYERRVGEIRGLAERDVLYVSLSREDRVERGVLVEGTLRVMVGTDGGDVLFTGAQAERAAALIEDAAMLERRITSAPVE